jgi:Flp pilus assembly protein TadD
VGESASPEGDPGDQAAAPGGDVYDWYVRGRDLLASGDAAAAAAVLSHAVAAEPGSRSAREMLARAQFDAHDYADAADNFGRLVAGDPADHYAHFGLGLASRRLGDLSGAVEHLALAAAMRPDLASYRRALRAARAALATVTGGESA